MKKKLATVTLSWVIIVLASVFCVVGQISEPDLKDKRITIRMDRQPLEKVFKYLMLDCDIAIGFEESSMDRGHDDYDFEPNLPYGNETKFKSADGNTQITVERRRVFTVKDHWFTVNVENGRLQDVLNLIVGQMQNYKWEINDGVVNIFPMQGRDEKYRELLNLNIKNFNLDIENHDPSKGAPILLIRTKIFELPEVVKFLDQNKILYSRDFRESLDNLRRAIPYLNFSNRSLRDLLNKITQIKRGAWILKKRDSYNTVDEVSVDIDI